MLFITHLLLISIYIYDDILGWRMAPNIKEYAPPHLGFPQFVLQTNPDGFRIPHEADDIPLEKKRLAILGDSVCLGYGLKLEETVGKVIETLSENKIISLNMSVVGYSTDQQLLVLERYGKKYKPDYVLFCLFTNDITTLLDSYPTENGRGKPVFSLENGKLLLKNVPVEGKSLYPDRYYDMVEFIYGKYPAILFKRGKELNRLEVILDLLSKEIFRKFIRIRHKKLVDYYIDLLSAIILRAKNFCDEIGCKIILALIPDSNQTIGRLPNADMVYNLIHRKINFVDVIKIKLSSKDFFPKNLHPNSSGHKKMAEQIFQVLKNLLKDYEKNNGN